MHIIDSVRGEARDAPESGIVAVVNHGRGKPGKRRKGKSLRRKLFSSAVDMIEDLLD